MDNKVVFDIEFDSEVWSSMNREQKAVWVDTVIDSINEHARVSSVRTDIKREVHIEVVGGVAHIVSAPDDVDVFIIDWDEEKENGR